MVPLRYLEASAVSCYRSPALPFDDSRAPASPSLTVAREVCGRRMAYCVLYTVHSMFPTALQVDAVRCSALLCLPAMLLPEFDCDLGQTDL